jgi:2-phosphosulfolactate phosphatase
MITAAAAGWRCFPVANLEEALCMAVQLADCLLAGELGGNMPEGFEITNSPAQIASRTDRYRPLILLSTSGTELLCRARRAQAAYAACFRNFQAVARHVATRHLQVAVIGAGSRQEFREEDQICCAWIAQHLLECGFTPADEQTSEIVERWRGMPVDACLISHSVDYLRRTNQTDDLEFILSRVNDIDRVFHLSGNELVAVDPAAPPNAIEFRQRLAT